MTSPRPTSARDGLVEHPMPVLSELLERLGKAGQHLGNAIAGYRDKDMKRSAAGLVEAGTAMTDAIEAITQLSDVMEELRDRARSACRIAKNRGGNVNWELLESNLRAAIEKASALLDGKQP